MKSKRVENEVWRRFKKNRLAKVGLAIMVFLALTAIFADVIVPRSLAVATDGKNRLNPPSAKHWFGTDSLGRDLFARVVHGSRISMSVGFSISFFSLLIGGFIGACAAYYGGLLDSVVMRLVDIVLGVPSILLAISIVAALGPNLLNLMIALVISVIPGSIRFVRSVVISITEQDYVEAALSYGNSHLRIILRYVLPNALGPMIVHTTTSIGFMILMAASLSFLGLGVQPPIPEWGAILSDARQYMRIAPYLMFFPTMAIVLAALSFNLVGDGLRDALDPKLRD